MLEARFGRFLPGFLMRRLAAVEARIERELERFAASLPAQAAVLDAGCGEGRHRGCFTHARYIGVDLSIGDARWNYRGIDAVADLAALPFRDAAFDAAVNVVVLEHTRRPDRVVAELARVLRPAGRLLLVAPQCWEVHQAPNDFFRFTRHGLALLFAGAGLQAARIEPIGGYFTLLARRLMNGLNFFQGGLRWLFFPPAAAVGLVCGLLLPALDRLDAERNFTLGYVCLVEKRAEPRSSAP